MRVALWLHVLASIVWIGGMFFAHVALRPAALTLPPPMRLPLMAATLNTFFQWVAAAVVTLILTGVFMIIGRGGFAAVDPSVHVMTALGLVMAAIFGFVVAVPFPRVRTAVAGGSWEVAAAALTQVRRLVGINLVLGLITVTVAILGHGVI